ncbi:MAG: phospho-N-acetylmuramoyl-pentapeptide-transferase [Demequinaceae bacterium]|nr:phospho-N-acetylmuramoyl-pentapeptide-transferase [Demequinaceae bacterium]
MIAVVLAGAIALTLSLFGTPLFIRYLTERQYGQFIRHDGPASHHVKRGTPTMGGVVLILATILGWLGSSAITGRSVHASALLIIGLMVGLGLIGFIDDAIKISRERSLGLKARWKILGQGAVGITFGVLALRFADSHGVTPGSTSISFLRDTGLDLAMWGATAGVVLFVIWANFLITAWSNAVNLTDGLDGLATGAAMVFFGAYTIVGIWQGNQWCERADALANCYVVRDPGDLAVLASAITGAAFGFLWWNAQPARIFMGDTGALALGGAIAGFSIVSRTEILAAIMGGLFVIVMLSVVLQVTGYRLTKKRIFRMAPLHHHFEQLGWSEVTIVTRFWIIAGLCTAAGMGLFYAEWAATL